MNYRSSIQSPTQVKFSCCTTQELGHKTFLSEQKKRIVNVTPKPYTSMSEIKNRPKMTKFSQNLGQPRNRYLTDITPIRKTIQITDKCSSVKVYERKKIFSPKSFSHKENVPQKNSPKVELFPKSTFYSKYDTKWKQNSENTVDSSNKEDDDDDVQLNNRFGNTSSQSMKKSPRKRSASNTYQRNKSPRLCTSLSIFNRPDNTESNEKSSPTHSSLLKDENDENKEPDVDLFDSVAKPSNMIGFPNYGNTCYLNAIIQTLLGLNTFITDLGDLSRNNSIIPTPLTLSIWNVILAKYKKDEPMIQTSLRNLKLSIEKIDDSFTGFKMQDANEFLTQVLDSMKDEVTSFLREANSQQIDMFNDRAVTDCSTPSNSNELESLKSIFDTPNSPEETVLSKLRLLSKEGDLANNNIIPNEDSTTIVKDTISDLTKNNPVISNFEFELIEIYQCLGCGESETKKLKNFALYVNLPDESLNNLQSSVDTYMSTDDKRELRCVKCGHETALVFTSFHQLPRILIVQLKRYEYDSYQCECIKVSSQVCADRWLKLNHLCNENVSKPPKFHPVPFSSYLCKDRETTLRNLDSEFNAAKDNKALVVDLFSPVKNSTPQVENNEGSSPPKLVNLETDEDHEFQKALKLSLEDKICYTPEPKPNTSLRDSNKVTNTNEEPFCEIEENSYRLVSIVSHFGQTTSTGHYVSDVLSVQDNQWIHYDDNSVVKVSENTVLSEGRQENGYIYFYVHKDTLNEMLEK